MSIDLWIIDSFINGSINEYDLDILLRSHFPTISQEEIIRMKKGVVLLKSNNNCSEGEDIPFSMDEDLAKDSNFDTDESFYNQNDLSDDFDYDSEYNFDESIFDEEEIF